MPSSSDSVVITIKLKAIFKFHAAAVLLFHILQKITSTKSAYFSKLCYVTSFQDPTLSSTSVTYSSQVHESSKKHMSSKVAFNGITFTSSFIKFVQ